MSKFTFFITVFLSLSIFARGDEVGNGAGYYENRVSFVFQNLENYLNSNNSSLSHEEKIIITEIKENLEIILENSNLIFVPQDDSFFIDNEFRLAYTFDRIGADIHFNLNILYNIPQQELSTTIISILIHELGHQIGIEDHFKLDVLGNKIAQSSIKKYTTYFFGELEQLGFFEVTSFNHPKTSDLIILNFQNSSINLTNEIENTMGCIGKFQGINFYQEIISKDLFGLLIFECYDSKKSNLKTIKIEMINHGIVKPSVKITYLE